MGPTERWEGLVGGRTSPTPVRSFRTGGNIGFRESRFPYSPGNTPHLSLPRWWNAAAQSQLIRLGSRMQRGLVPSGAAGGAEPHGGCIELVPALGAEPRPPLKRRPGNEGPGSVSASRAGGGGLHGARPVANHPPSQHPRLWKSLSRYARSRSQ